jgi:hypothetical protein
MRLAAISDIHDNAVNLKSCLRWCRKAGVGELVCCGDLTNRDTLRALARGFAGPVHLVRGNAELYEKEDLKQYGNICEYGRAGRIERLGRSIGFCHEPHRLPQVLALGSCDIVFYGHTHKPWEEEKDGTRFINPGTLSGMFQKATFAVLEMESGKVALKLLDTINN